MPFTWGLALLVSWIGWGTLVAEKLRLRRRAEALNWGLRGGIGMAVHLAVAGLFLAVHWAGAEAALLITVGGWVAGGYEIMRTRGACLRGMADLGWFGWVVIAVLSGASGFFYLASINTPGMLNAFDDLTTYQVFVQRLLQTGTIIEPFNWRRLSTYGGQQILQVPLVLAGNSYSANILDLGLSNILVMGIGAWLVRGRSMQRRVAQLAVIALVLLIPVPRVNTQSQCSTAVLLLAAYALMQLPRQSAGVACLVGIVAGGACTFRMNVVPVALLLVMLGYGALGRWRQAGIALGTLCLMLVPYAVSLYESSVSLMFPLMQGTHQSQYQLTAAPMTVWEHVRMIAAFFLRPEMIGLSIPFVLTLAVRRLRRTAALYIAALVGTAMLIWAFPRSDTENSIRLTFCILLTPALVVFARWMVTGKRSMRWVGGAAMAAGILLPTWQRVPAHLEAMAYAAWVGPQLRNGYPIPMSNEAYRLAQLMVPVGDAFLAATGAPLVLDYRRNVIYNVDSPGTASLPPGMPLYDGPEAMKRYLAALHIDYIVAADFDRDIALYSRRRWQATAEDPAAQSRMDQAGYRPMLAFIGNVDALARTEDLVFSGGGLRVIRLRHEKIRGN